MLMLGCFFWFSEISFEGRLTSDKSVEVTTRLAWLVGKHICNTKSRTPSMGCDRQLQHKHK